MMNKHHNIANDRLSIILLDTAFKQELADLNKNLIKEGFKPIKPTRLEEERLRNMFYRGFAQGCKHMVRRWN